MLQLSLIISSIISLIWYFYFYGMTLRNSLNPDNKKPLHPTFSLVTLIWEVLLFATIYWWIGVILLIKTSLLIIVLVSIGQVKFKEHKNKFFLLSFIDFGCNLFVVINILNNII